MITPTNTRIIVDAHDEYWEQLRPDLYDLRAAYLHRFWDRQQIDPGQLLIETSAAYEYIEGYIASIFSRNPSVNAQQGIIPGGDAEKAEGLATNFLTTSRAQIEQACRMALIYPMAFCKLTPCEDATSVADCADLTALPPWEVILDFDAPSWERQRFCGHTYWLPQDDVTKLYGAKKFDWVDLEDYWRDSEKSGETETAKPEGKAFKYVRIVELYCRDMLYVWSPQYADGLKFVEKMKIPFTRYDGSPRVTIAPLYFSREPDAPLKGYSALRRVYDQLQEMNYIRTYQASAVRKAARQWILKNGAFSEDQLTRLTSGEDGTYVFTDEDDVRKCIQPVPHTPTPPELENYYHQVQSDADRGNILAPFTRGEATKATATEVVSLQRYTASEVGRLAREKDGLIEELSSVYVDVARWWLSTTKKTKTTGTILIDGKPTSVSADDLTADFRFFSEDSGQTPLSAAAQKQEILTLMPMLQQLGVPRDSLLKYLADTFDLPDAMLAEQEAQQETMPGEQQETMPGEQMPPMPPMPGGTPGGGGMI